ncbi:MAG: polymer-forming cytoskeletal protein, partial [Acidaminococcaceae bacterium]|nr:polymer-forming cytoskeletal protein [Acidaminococcaceae bacterium]
MKKKFRLSLFMSKKIHKALTAGVLACVVSCGAVLPVEAATQIWRSYGTGTGRQTDFEFAGVTPNWGGTNYGSSNAISNNGTILYKVAFGSPQETGAHMAGDGINDGSYTSAIDNFTIAYDIKTGTAKYYYSEYQYDDDDEGTFTWELTATEVQRALGSTPLSSVLNAVKGGSSYDAGNGITISSDNKVSVKASNGIDVGSNGVSVKAGTNVTVNANGVSVTGNGSVADGNTGLINGDKLYDEVRSSANGNYVKTNNTTAANLKALDDKIGAASVANGTYIKTGNTVNANLKALDSQIGELNEDGGYIQKNNNVSQNLAALDNAIDNVVNSGLQFGANSGDDVTNKIGSKVSIIGGGTKADSEYDSKNIKTIIVQDENGNTQIEIDLDKNPEFASILTEGDANIGGKLNVGGDTHLKSNLQIDGDTNISGNTTIEKDLMVKGDSNLEGNAHVYQNLQVDGDTNISGNTTIEKDLMVKGDSNLEGNAHVYQNLQVDGDTNISGNTTIEKDLTVKGDSNLEGNAHV